MSHEDHVKKMFKDQLEKDNSLEKDIDNMLDTYYGKDGDVEDRVKTYLWLLQAELMKIKAQAVDLNDAQHFLLVAESSVATLLNTILKEDDMLQLEVLGRVINHIMEENGLMAELMSSMESMGINKDESDRFDLSGWK